MDSGGNLPLQLLLLVALILINAFFACSEMAIVSSNDAMLRHLADEGDKKATQLVRLLARPSHFLAAIQVGITVSSLLSSAVASESMAGRISAALSASFGWPVAAVKAVSVALITLLLSYFTLVFGELVPKRVAMKSPEKISLRVIPVLHGVSVVFRPFVSLLSHSTNAVASLFGVEPGDDPNNVTEEEIRMMVDVGEENGTIDESEKEMINNVFDFNDRTAGEVMSHRTEISAVEDTASLADIIEIAIHEGFSRIPVYHEDLDDIVGIIFAKDLLRYVGKPASAFNLRDTMRPPLIVPETMRCQDLFVELTERKQHMAVVIDEYGGTAGIVTMEDVLESIVGSIQDEYDHEEEEYAVIDDSTYTIEGTALIDEVDRLLDIELPEGDYDTLGGFLIDRLGRIPTENEHPTVETPEVTFTVESVEDRRIDKVRAVRKPPAPPEAEQQ